MTLHVDSREFMRHTAPNGKQTVKAIFTCGIAEINHWLCPDHVGYAKAKADQFWKEHGGQLPTPNTVGGWLDRQAELSPTAEICVRHEGEYPKIYKIVATHHPTTRRHA